MGRFYHYEKEWSERRSTEHPERDGERRSTFSAEKYVALQTVGRSHPPKVDARNKRNTMFLMNDSGKGLLKDLFTLALLIVIVVIPIRVFVASPFVVDGESMHPTFENLDYLIIDELVYDFHAPQRGDVIVFRYPNDPSIFYIKRVIGLPGETVAINRGNVTITKTDGSQITLSEPYVVNEDATYTKNVILSRDQYFVMGDNRPNSSDSRVWGPLPTQDIIGRVDLRLLPLVKAGFFPGETSYENALSTTTAAAQ